MSASSSKQRNSKRVSAHIENLSEQERRDFLRDRNTENARRNRMKWRESDREMQELYEMNEKRIQNLEKMAVDLSNELNDKDRKSKRISKHVEGNKKSVRASKHLTMKNKNGGREKKPEWFGEPF